MKWKFRLTAPLVLILLLSVPGGRVNAQVPGVGIVTGVLKKVIVAIDLKVQALQNKTIALQNGEQRLENALHLRILDNISGWLGKEKALYAGYYQELNTVRGLIADYEEVRSVISKQKQLLSACRQARSLFNRDPHFSAAELGYMGRIYNGILQESLQDLDQLLMAVSTPGMQMDDAERLQKIGQAAKAMQTSLDHLRQFNRQNAGLSLMRAKDAQDRQDIRQRYGIS